jgi:ATP-binding cassette subfamily B protein
MGKVKQEPVSYMIRRMWEFSQDQKPKIILMWVLAILGRLVWLAPALVFGLFLNEAQINGINQTNLYYIFFLLFLVFLASVGGWLFHGPSRILERSIGYKIDRYYKKYLYNAVLALPLTWHSDHDSGDTIDKVNKATEAMFEFSRSTFLIVSVIVRIFGTTAVLIYFNFYIAILALIILAAAIIVLLKFDKVLIPQYKTINEYDNKASAKVYDAMSNVTTIKVLRIEETVLSGLKDSWWSSYKTYMKNKILVEWKWFFGGVIFDLLAILPLVVYIYYNYSLGNVILVGTISTLYMYLKDFVEVYYTIASTYEEITIQKARVLGVNEIEGIYLNLYKTKKKEIHKWSDVVIDNLNFKYDLSDAKSAAVLNNFFIKFKSGEKIAIIGESGSGKSSLLKVLHGMYENIFANVLIDEKGLEKNNKKTDLARLDISSTLVPQEPEVFSASIKENLTLLLDFSDEEIKRATDAAMFTDVIDNLPNKIDSVVNEKGVNLSGGQKQRLALARALLFSSNKKLILLDESTSSVDPINEVKIYQNIFENFKNSTILASIHKMNLLKYFDRILIMESGKIVDEGSFEELLVKNIEFKKSWEEYVRDERTLMPLDEKNSVVSEN